MPRTRLGDVFPGARGFEKGHQLTLVVLGTAGDDHASVARFVGEARLKRWRRPQVQRIGRLDIVVAVEQNVGHAGWAIPAVMGDHHRVASGFDDLGFGKADGGQR